MPADIQGAVDELAAITDTALADSGKKIVEVAHEINATRYPITRLRRGTWLEHGLSKEMVKRILCGGLNVDEATWKRSEYLFDVITQWSKPNGRSRSKVTRIVRFGRTEPFPHGRDYGSIDRFELDRLSDGRIEGVIERIEPEARRGALWQCVGRITADTLLLSFWPATTADEGAPQSDSDGVMLIQREASRGRAWPGMFLKLERHAGAAPRLHEYPYWLSLPSDRHLVDACSTVAVLDLDNTLVDGWVLERWMRMLGEVELGHAREGAERLARLFDAYRADPGYGHDRLAHEAAGVYAASLCDLDDEELTPLAKVLVDDYLAADGSIFPATRRLLDGLRERGLRPVLITGAPSEVALPLARELRIESVFALIAARDHTGRFTGEVEVNHGLSTLKRAVCDKLREIHDCNLLVAIGDSEGDRPMWDAAHVSVRVGGLKEAGDVTISGVDLTTPLNDAFWELIPRASWLQELGRGEAG